MLTALGLICSVRVTPDLGESTRQPCRGRILHARRRKGVIPRPLTLPGTGRHGLGFTSSTLRPIRRSSSPPIRLSRALAARARENDSKQINAPTPLRPAVSIGARRSYPIARCRRPRDRNRRPRGALARLRETGTIELTRADHRRSVADDALDVTVLYRLLVRRRIVAAQPSRGDIRHREQAAARKPGWTGRDAENRPCRRPRGYGPCPRRPARRQAARRHRNKELCRTYLKIVWRG